jgi:hypothetical protein
MSSSTEYFLSQNPVPSSPTIPSPTELLHDKSLPVKTEEYPLLPSRIGFIYAENFLKDDAMSMEISIAGDKINGALLGTRPLGYQVNLGQVENPRLELFNDKNKSVFVNDDWRSRSDFMDLNRSIRGWGIDLHEKDAAGIFEFSPGKYLAQVTGVAQESGETAIRFIQLDGTNLGGRVSSFSIRGYKEKTKDFELSFFLDGMEARKVLIVAKGKNSFDQAGISGGLPNPEIGNQQWSWLPKSSNDDWEDYYRAEEIAQTGFAPESGSNEAAILMDLSPGYHFFNIGNSMFANEGLVEVVVFDLGKGDENGGPPFSESNQEIFDDNHFMSNLSVTGSVGDGKTIELDFVAEGKPSWLIVNGLSKEEARAGGTDPKIELFNKNEKMVGVSDNWRDENSSDQINNLENFPPPPGEWDSSLLLEGVRPGFYRLKMDAKGSLGESEINVVPYDSSKLRIKEMTIRGWVEPDRPIRFMLPFLDSTKVLISVKGLESGVVDGLANPVLWIPWQEINDWREHERSGEVASSQYSPTRGGSELVIMSDFGSSWGMGNEGYLTDVRAKAGSSGGYVEIKIINLGKSTPWIAKQEDGLKNAVRWNQDGFYSPGNVVYNATLFYRALGQVFPGIPLSERQFWENIQTEPIVYTGEVLNPVSLSSTTLKGLVIESGSENGLSRKGFLLATHPTPDFGNEGVIEILANRELKDGSFEADTSELLADRKYFYKAFGFSMDGQLAYGSVLSFRTPQVNNSPAWANAQPSSAANWWTSSWFGSFYMNEVNASWIMHSELGWLYPMASGKSGVWLWKENLGWLWTDEENFPFLYQNSSAGWLYFYGASQDRLLFYHYRDERWLQMNKGGDAQ